MEAGDTDVELLGRIALGEETAMRLFYERHKAMVGRLTKAAGVPLADARELVQETFVRAWRGAGSFRREASAAAWLRGIARHLIADHVDAAVKARHVFAPAPDAEEDAATASSEPGPERLAELAQARRCIDQCMRKLSAPHREVLALRVCGAELKESEVARLLGVPLGTVKSRTSIALRSLAACVEHCAGSDHG